MFPDLEEHFLGISISLCSLGHLVTMWGCFVPCIAFHRFFMFWNPWVTQALLPSQSQAEEEELILLYGGDVPKCHQESRTRAQQSMMPGVCWDEELPAWRDAQGSQRPWLSFAVRCSSIRILHCNWIKQALVLPAQCVTKVLSSSGCFFADMRWSRAMNSSPLLAHLNSHYPCLCLFFSLFFLFFPNQSLYEPTQYRHAIRVTDWGVEMVLP